MADGAAAMATAAAPAARNGMICLYPNRIIGASSVVSTDPFRVALLRRGVLGADTHYPAPVNRYSLSRRVSRAAPKESQTRTWAVWFPVATVLLNAAVALVFPARHGLLCR